MDSPPSSSAPPVPFSISPPLLNSSPAPPLSPSHSLVSLLPPASSLLSSSILLFDTSEKRLVLLLTFPSSKALLLLSRKQFEKDLLFEKLLESHLTLYFQNDIFKRFQVLMTKDNEVDLQVIYPASQKLIEKYTAEKNEMFQESYEIFNRVVRPFIDAERLTSIKWIYNILDKNAEVESIIYEDTDPKLGFVMLPDYAFKGDKEEELHVIALVNRRDLGSLRDLRGEHIELLENIRAKGAAAIQLKYNLPLSSLRIFLHYHPTYYHLHVHFTHINKMDRAINCERAHLLNDVVQNLKIKNDYYQIVVLEYKLNRLMGLYKILVKESLLEEKKEEIKEIKKI